MSLGESVEKRNRILRNNYLSSLEVLKELSEAQKRGQVYPSGEDNCVYVSRSGVEKKISLEKVKEHMENVENLGIISLNDVTKAKRGLSKVLP